MYLQRKVLKITLPVGADGPQAVTARYERPTLFFSITYPPHPAGYTTTLSTNPPPQSGIARFAPVNSPTPIKSRPTKLPIKKRKRSLGAKNYGKEVDATTVSIFGAKLSGKSRRKDTPTPPAKRARRGDSAVSATTVLATASAVPAVPDKSLIETSAPEELFDRPTAPGKVFTMAQARWAIRMLEAYLAGMETLYANEINDQLAAKFPNTVDIEIDDIVLGEDLVIEGLVDSVLGGWFTVGKDKSICGGEFWEAESPKATAKVLGAVEEMLGRVREMRMRIVAGMGLISGNFEVGADEEDAGSETGDGEYKNQDGERGGEVEEQKALSTDSDWYSEESEDE